MWRLLCYRGTGGEVWASLEARAAVGDNRGGVASVHQERAEPTIGRPGACLSQALLGNTRHVSELRPKQWSTMSRWLLLPKPQTRTLRQRERRLRNRHAADTSRGSIRRRETAPGPHEAMSRPVTRASQALGAGRSRCRQGLAADLRGATSRAQRPRGMCGNEPRTGGHGTAKEPYGVRRYPEGLVPRTDRDGAAGRGAGDVHGHLAPPPRSAQY